MFNRNLLVTLAVLAAQATAIEVNTLTGPSLIEGDVQQATLSYAYGCE